MDEIKILNDIQTPEIISNKLLVYPDLVNEWNRWFLTQGYSLDSAKTYFSFLKKFVGFEIEITQKKVDKFRELNKGAVSSSALKSFFKFLVNKKEYPIELLNIRFERNKQSKKMPESISLNEVQLIIEGMDNEGLKNKLMTMLCYELALRISEALKLKWSDFNWLEWLNDKTQYGKVSLKDTKGGKFRVVPVKPELMNLLYDNHSNRTERGVPIGDLLFEMGSGIMSYLNNKEQKNDMNLHDYLDYAKRSYRNVIYRVSKEKLGKRINPHMLRHSKAQYLLDSGMPIESISEFLGHSSLSVTQVYARASPEKVKKDLEKYDENKNSISNI